jgi:hypothetical protein
MKNLQFILKENAAQLFSTERVSTFGYKFELNGEWHGEYVIIKNPYATVQDVMEALELLCPCIEQTWKEFQADTKSTKMVDVNCVDCSHAKRIGEHEWECVAENYDIEHFSCFSPKHKD